MNESILIIFVIYNKSLLDVKSLYKIYATNNIHDESKSEKYNIKNVSIYIHDNSDNHIGNEHIAKTHFSTCKYFHSPINGGTYDAYKKGVAIATSMNMPWVMLFDQDTDIPNDYIEKTFKSINECKIQPSIIFPLVRHGGRLISPSIITYTGKIIPWSSSCNSKNLCRRITGISSGITIRTVELQKTFPLPEGLWLDYVDHYMILKILRNNNSYKVSGVSLDHDLSVMNKYNLSVNRMQSILHGENIFIRGLGLPAIVAYKFRLIARALIYLIKRPDLSKIIIKQILKKQATKNEK